MSGDIQHTQLVAHQLELEKLYSKNQTIPRIKAEFENCKEIDFKAYMALHGIKPEFGFDVLVQIALHRRADLKTMVGLLWHHEKDSQKTTNALLKCAEVDLLNWDPLTKTFVLIFQITQEVQADLDRFQYPLPMVVEPRPIENNRTSGYYLNQKSVILKHYNHHEEDVCLDHLNRANAVKLTINHKVVAMVKNKWKNLDKHNEGETEDEYKARVKAFEKYDRVAKDVMNKLQQHNDHFYLTHRYDKRGRVYAQGYHVNYQGNPWNKSCVEFADKEYVK